VGYGQYIHICRHHCRLLFDRADPADFREFQLLAYKGPCHARPRQRSQAHALTIRSERTTFEMPNDRFLCFWSSFTSSTRYDLCYLCTMSGYLDIRPGDIGGQLSTGKAKLTQRIRLLQSIACFNAKFVFIH